MSINVNNDTQLINCSSPNVTKSTILTLIPSYNATVFGVYFLPIVVILGTAGNLISIIILNRASKTNSSHFYLWWLAVFDIISLWSYIPSFWAVILLRPYYYHIRGPDYATTWVEYVLMGNYICQIRVFITFTARTCSIYTIILVTVERFVMVLFPMNRVRFCTLSSARVAIGLMVAAAVLINLPWFFAFKVESKPCFPPGICKGNLVFTINRMFESTMLCLVPCLIIIVCNSCIIYVLRDRWRLGILVKSLESRKQERDITIRLLAVSFAFFFLTIPSLVVTSIRTVRELGHKRGKLRGPDADAFALSVILFALNLAINFIIYCLTGKNFRTAAWALVKCNWRVVRKYQIYLETETTPASGSSRLELRLVSEDRSFSMDLKCQLLIKDHAHHKRSVADA